jgi:putative nucleotidyltransferase with HDIG domain
MEAITDFMTSHGIPFDSATPLPEALNYMKRHGLGSILVSESGKPVGIFTERDVLMKLDFDNPSSISELTLKQVMSDSLYTVESDTTCSDALIFMNDKGIRNLPIIHDGTILGIVSLRKLLNHYAFHMERLLNETIEALTSAIGQRDPYTVDHQRRVSLISVAIAKEMGLEAGHIDGLRMAALTHDVGKIDVPIELLSKPGKLSKAEFELIKQHPEAGYKILESVAFERPVAEMVLQHHERMDGSGYPRGLRGNDILLESRIMGIADVFEAIMSFRPYRQALGIDKAREEIANNSGTSFDPDIVDVFLELLDDPESGIMKDF